MVSVCSAENKPEDLQCDSAPYLHYVFTEKSGAKMDRELFWENGPTFGKWSHFFLSNHVCEKKTVPLTKGVNGAILWKWKWVHFFFQCSLC